MISSSMRVRIRLAESNLAKIAILYDDMSFEEVLEVVVKKLRLDTQSCLQGQRWALFLDGKYEIEDVLELQNDDELMVKLVTESAEQVGEPQVETRAKASLPLKETENMKDKSSPPELDMRSNKKKETDFMDKVASLDWVEDFGVSSLRVARVMEKSGCSIVDAINMETKLADKRQSLNSDLNSKTTISVASEPKGAPEPPGRNRPLTRAERIRPYDMYERTNSSIRNKPFGPKLLSNLEWIAKKVLFNEV